MCVRALYLADKSIVAATLLDAHAPTRSGIIKKTDQDSRESSRFNCVARRAIVDFPSAALIRASFDRSIDRVAIYECGSSMNCSRY